MKYTKLLSVVIALTILFYMMPTNTFAANAAVSLAPSKSSVVRGESFTVSIKITNYSSIDRLVTMLGLIKYDKSILDATNVSIDIGAGNFNSQYITINNGSGNAAENEIYFLYSDDQYLIDTTAHDFVNSADGKLITITFKAKVDAALGASTITFTSDAAQTIPNSVVFNNASISIEVTVPSLSPTPSQPSNSPTPGQPSSINQ